MSIPFNIDLKNKVVVVTGGGGVLCGAFAKALAECGAKVAILDLRKEMADKVAAEINEAGGTAIGALGTCDILINGAGGNHPKGTTTKEYLFKEDLVAKEGIVTFFDLDPKGIEFVFNLNFIGTLLPTQTFAKDMIDKGAVIINISSMNAFTPLTKIPAYSGAKAAISNFTQWLAVHMSKVNIRVNAIAPGFFITDQNRGMLIQPDGSFSERAQKIISQTPMGRFGEDSELIGTLLWLVSNDASGFVNGTVIPVDGGFSAYSGV
jgi:NAD(P)-dependent dehydrogenase (short-subunit alcohol dehydrogenase family)